MIYRNANLRWIRNRNVRSSSNLTLVTLRRIEDCKEWLLFRSAPPMSPCTRIVPNSARFDDVVIFLRVVRTVIASSTQNLREHFGSCWHRHHRSHVDSTSTRRIHSSDNGSSCRCTDWNARPRPLKYHPVSSQGIDIGSLGIEIAVASHLWAVIFARNPKDIGFPFGTHFRITGCSQDE